MLAHIAGIPVQEWSPFIVPVVALYLYGRHSSRKRQAALERAGERASSFDEAETRRVLAQWAKAGHDELKAEHVRLLFPPGVDGARVSEIASRVGCAAPVVQTSLDELAELGYVDLEEDDAAGDAQVWLTATGFDLTRSMEDLLLERVR